MLVGATDTGKSTLARQLFEYAGSLGRPAAYLDGDPGQAVLGPPTTVTVGISDPSTSTRFPPGGGTWRAFTGFTTPRGRLLDLVLAEQRLARRARQSLAPTGVIFHDTCGLIAPAGGGAVLKWAEIDALRPAAVLAIQRDHEMEPVLAPLRRSRKTKVVERRPAAAARRRSQPARQRRRQILFAEYFQGASLLRLDWPRLAVYPSPRFTLRQLVGLEDSQGFALGLGILVGIHRSERNITLFTPLHSTRGVDALRLGTLLLDPETFVELPGAALSTFSSVSDES